MVKGTVSISIEDYHALIDGAVILKQKEEKLQQATQELQVFLSFICTRSNLRELIDEFNRQSKTATIDLENGKAKIILKEK